METHSTVPAIGGKKFLSHKELAKHYSVHPVTLRTWLNKITELHRVPGQRIYSVQQQEIIFSHLGNPFT